MSLEVGKILITFQLQYFTITCDLKILITYHKRALTRYLNGEISTAIAVSHDVGADTDVLAAVGEVDVGYDQLVEKDAVAVRHHVGRRQHPIVLAIDLHHVLVGVGLCLSITVVVPVGVKLVIGRHVDFLEPLQTKAYLII